jgi:hypothetical protein
LDFRLPWPAKIAAGMLTPGKWWPFEIYLTTAWTAPYFDHTYLGFPSIKSNGFFTKTKEASIIYSNLDTFNSRRSWNTCFMQISSQRPQNFAQKTLPFFRKKFSKIKKKLRIFEIFFFVILVSCFTNVLTQNCILRQKLFPCVGFWDIDS